MHDRDIIVIGGGPAGTLYGLLAAQAGLRVTIIDKARFPRPKVCGHRLNPDCWAILEDAKLANGIRALPHRKLTSLELSFEHSAKKHLLPTPSERDWRAINRQILDDWLKNQAVAAGAEFLGGISPLKLIEPNRVSTDTGIYSGKILVGADGRLSWLANAGEFLSFNPRDHRIAWQAVMPAEKTGNQFQLKFFSEGYLSMTPLSETQINISMVLRKPVKPQAVAQRVLHCPQTLVWRSVSPLGTRRPNPPAKGNWLLLGDAIQTFEPFTELGLVHALQTAALAAKLTVKHFSEKPSTWTPLYTRAVQEFNKPIPFRKKNLADWIGKHPQFAIPVLKFFPRLVQS